MSTPQAPATTTEALAATSNATTTTGGAAAPAGQGSAGSAAPAGTSATHTTPDWKSSFNPELKAFIDNKQFKDPSDLATSYQNMEKLLGAPKERLLKLPEAFTDDKGKPTAEARALYERLGAPKEAKEYELPVPKEGGDSKLMEHFAGIFHEAGIPKDAGKKIAESWNAYQQQIVQANKEATTLKFNQDVEGLKKEWGAAVDQNTNIAKEAVRTMGLTSEQTTAIAAALGHAETMKLFHKFGKQVGESSFVSGQRNSEIREPSTAKAKIKELMSDKSFGKRLMEGESEAKRIWNQLHEQAANGQMMG